MSEAGWRALNNWLSIFVTRPRLTGSFLLATIFGVGLTVFGPPQPTATILIVSWDVACLVFLVSIGGMMMDDSPEHIRARAEREDEGRGLILTVVLVAAAASVWAISVQLGIAKAEHGVLRTAHVVLAFVTVALSWMMMQVIFALHYAHEYYDENVERGGQDMKGLSFPGGELPDYWDFVHFSIVIGVAAQTADIAFTSKTLRRIGTVHSLVAFAFNTVVVALTINLLAGLF
jgi:uncharacterized membrane protein